MSLGILISMFTAVVLMRMMMESLVRRRKPARLAIAPLIGGVPAPGAFSFMRRGRLALAVSAALSLGAVAALVWPGPNLGIDFTGGVQMVLRSDAPVPLAELRAAIAAGVPGDASLQAFGDPNEALIRVQGEAGQATVAAVEAAAAQAVPGAVFDQIDLVGPTISGELATTGLIALSLAVLAMLAYIWVRFEWHFAAGAIVVLFLDVTKTFGVIAVTGWEVNLTTIVALLTLIGYSVNDKVVVYDRIREHLRGGGGDEPLADRDRPQPQPGSRALHLHLRHDAGGAAADGDLGWTGCRRVRLADDRGRGDRDGIIAVRLGTGAGMARRTQPGRDERTRITASRLGEARAGRSDAPGAIRLTAPRDFHLMRQIMLTQTKVPDLNLGRKRHPIRTPIANRGACPTSFRRLQMHLPHQMSAFRLGT